MENTDQIKAQILEALMHPEAEEGLYFRNFFHLHEEDERPVVKADQEEILSALKDLIDIGRVQADDTGEEVIFKLIQ